MDLHPLPGSRSGSGCSFMHYPYPDPDGPKWWIRFISTNGFKSFWSASPSVNKSFFSFNFDSFKDSLHFLIKNSYLNFGNKIFHQKIGIPMGSNYSPLLADLFLFHCEYKFLSNPKNKDLSFCFSNITRYIDDIAAINIPNFSNYLKEIYPKSLDITETDSSSTVNYLDVQVKLSKPFSYTIFDKREQFNFPIVNFPFSNSNVPKNLLYAVFVSQLHRFARLCSKIDLYNARLKPFVEKLCKQGYNVKQLRRKYAKFCNCNFQELAARDFIKLCPFPI